MNVQLKIKPWQWWLISTMAMLSCYGVAELQPVSEQDLSAISGKAGATFLMQGMELNPNGMHPVLDPDNLPDIILSDTANSIEFYGDSTSDGESKLDFWVSVRRITTSTDAKTPNNTKSGPMFEFEVDMDISTKQIERLYRDNVDQQGVATADENTKLSFMVLSMDGMDDKGTASLADDTIRWMDFGVGDSAKPSSSFGAYVDIDGGNSVTDCSSVTYSTEHCYFKGVSMVGIDSFSLQPCAAGAGACDGNFIQEINFWGRAKVQGQILAYGRNPGL